MKPLSALHLAAVLIAAAIALPSAAAEKLDSIAPTKPRILVVVGAPGEEQYGRLFAESATRWKQLLDDGAVNGTLIEPNAMASSETGEGETSDTENGEAASQLDLIEAEMKTIADDSPPDFWLILIGHGTFDGKTPRFNLVDDDLSADQLATWLQAIRSRTVVVNCTSASAPFINALSGPARAIITATKTGSEQQVTRFADAFSRVIVEDRPDLDKDGQTSLLEAFLIASRAVQQSYRDDERLATEHALLDDNGDRRGTRAESFDGFRIDPSKVKNGNPDGALARDVVLLPGSDAIQLTDQQRQKRDALERQLSQIRAVRSDPPTERDLSLIESIALELAELYDAAETAAHKTPAPGAENPDPKNTDPENTGPKNTDSENTVPEVSSPAPSAPADTNSQSPSEESATPAAQ